jgi:hypothetical protein
MIFRRFPIIRIEFGKEFLRVFGKIMSGPGTATALGESHGLLGTPTILLLWVSLDFLEGIV